MATHAEFAHVVKLGAIQIRSVERDRSEYMYNSVSSTESFPLDLLSDAGLSPNLALLSFAIQSNIWYTKLSYFA